RLLGYRARVLTGLLAALSKEAEEPAPNLEGQFLEARKRLDWKAVQELGVVLVTDHPEYVPILRKSLVLRPA
ncbi:hypothetical protein, partial [Klebsiella pneumoniae]|uniref:hypothetical protein n=1 Tax=Klebsiella pneumoniae TaxID=573 RepID=UPI003F520871